MSEDYINTTEASKIYGVTPQTIRKWVSDDKIPYKRVNGNKILVPSNLDIKKSKTSSSNSKKTTSNKSDATEGKNVQSLYWNELSVEESKNLLSSIGINYIDSNSVKNPSYTKKINLGSDHTIKKTLVPKNDSFDTCTLLSPASLAQKWGKEDVSRRRKVAEKNKLEKEERDKAKKVKETKDDKEEKNKGKFGKKVKDPTKSNKSRKIRIYPTEKQKRKLLVWMSDARFNYNYCVKKYREQEQISEIDVRNKVITNERGKRSNKVISEDRPIILLDTMKRTPKDIRAKAAFEYVTAHTNSLKIKNFKKNPEYIKLEKISNFIKLKEELKECEEELLKLTNNLVGQFSTHERKLQKKIDSVAKKKEKTVIKLEKLKSELYKLDVILEGASLANLTTGMENIKEWCEAKSVIKYRLKKNLHSHIGIPKTAATVTHENNTTFINIYPDYKIGKIKCDENVDLTADFMIRRNNKLDIWEIEISSGINIAEDKVYDNFICFDPGVRTFLTGINSDGEVLEYNNNWDKIERKLRIIDKSQQCIMEDRNNHKKTRKQKEIERKAKKEKTQSERKISNIIIDLHRKVAKDIVQNYDLIILPKLRTNQLVRKGNLPSVVKRKITAISHCKFHDYISYKAKVNGKTLVEVNESHTTQTCYNCGKINNIGMNKVYNCKYCNNETDRDIQASLNILTKYMGFRKRLS